MRGMSFAEQVEKVEERNRQLTAEDTKRAVKIILIYLGFVTGSALLAWVFLASLSITAGFHFVCCLVLGTCSIIGCLALAVCLPLLYFGVLD